MRLILFILLIINSLGVRAQLGPERAAFNRIEKEKWAKARQLVRKAIRKDSINAEAKMVYSIWFFSPDNPNFNIDSAHHYSVSSLHDYNLSTIRQRERMKRFPLDSTILLLLIKEIDSAAFERAKQINTEEAYISFLANFPDAKQSAETVELRDEVAFLDALKTNTHQSFKKFIDKYPSSHRTAEAIKKYDKLLYESETQDRKLASYVMFHNKYPDSPYLDEVENQILELSTASGEPADFLKFVEHYPESKWTKRAKDILYHLYKQNDDEFPQLVLSDSIRRVIDLESKYWVPFLKGEVFGFMDEDGIEQLSAQFSDINPDYICGAIDDDFLNIGDGIIGRTGKYIYKGSYEDTEDMGYGFLEVKDGDCTKIIHKSGWLFEDCLEEASIVANRFISIRKNNKWGLFTFTGKKILDFNYESIETAEGVILLSRSGKKSLHLSSEIFSLIEGKTLQEELVFDDSRKLGEGLLLVKNGSLEGVLDRQLKFIIPLDRQILTKTSYGFLRQINRMYKPIGVSDAIDKEEFIEVRPYLRWIGLFKKEKASLFDVQKRAIVMGSLDSLWFTNRVALAKRNDSVHVFLNTGRRLQFSIGNEVTFMKSADSVQFFYAQEKDKRSVYHADSGNKMFTLDFNDIEYLGYGIFLITKSGKKGLVDLGGRTILPSEYDAIVKADPTYVSLLKEKRFGLFDLINKRLIKATFERNVRQYGRSLLVAFKEGKFGFIDWEAQPISTFEFEEVRIWNDTAALVRKDFQWMIFDIHSNQVAISRIKDYRLIRDDDIEKLAIVHIENEFGVVSNVTGTIIQPTFSDIVNVGTPDKPLYFTEKHVEEARIFVVIYYDHRGLQLRRHIYEDEDYDRIYCHEN